jgi:uncharacterized protein YdcH (DUF465 family)
MKQIKFRISDEMYSLLAREAARANQSPSAYTKQKIEYHLTGGNAQIDRISSSIEQLTHRVYASRNEADLLSHKMIEAISGMQDSLIDIDQRGIRLQQAINFCAAHAEIILQKEGGRDAVSSMWKSINIRTGISQSQDKREGDESG